MTGAICLSQSPTTCKNTVKRIGTRIKEASSQVQKATNKLNDANKSDLSYEINQLESMYRDSQNYASEFETFAGKVENMVNSYIETDNACAKKIRTNGKNHRKKMGLPKNIMVATVGATFERVEDLANEFIGWVDDILEFSPTWNAIESLLNDVNNFILKLPIIGYIQENWSAISGIAGNILQIGVGIFGVLSGVGLIPGIVSIVMGVDQLIGNVFYDGKSTLIKDLLTTDFIPSWIVDVVYDGVDILSGFYSFNWSSSLSVIDKINKLDKVSDRLRMVQTLEVFDYYADYIKGSQKMLGIANNAQAYKDIIINDGEGLYKRISKKVYKNTYKRILGISSSKKMG